MAVRFRARWGYAPTFCENHQKHQIRQYFQWLVFTGWFSTQGTDEEWRFDPSKAQAHLGKRLRLLAELRVLTTVVNITDTGCRAPFSRW